MTEECSADSLKCKDEEDEEEDFAQVSDLVGPGLSNEANVTPEDGHKA